MLHEIGGHHFNNTYQKDREMKKDDYILYYENNLILLIEKDEGLQIPKAKDFCDEDLRRTTYLFSIDDRNCFLVNDCNWEVVTGATMENIYILRSFPIPHLGWIGSAGYHLHSWYLSHKFCGKCGTHTVHSKVERALSCPKCNHVIYPTISPAVIVAIIDGDYILLAQGKHYPGHFYSLVAGYVEVGETLEQAVKREVKEEIGITISDLQYFGSQPWPFSGSMMIGYFAKGNRSESIFIDPIEIADAKWFHRIALPEIPPRSSIARAMIETFRQQEHL